jgi:hypothetical protein
MLHPLVAVQLAILIVLIFSLPRKYVITPFLVGVFCISLGQVVVLAGVHFTVLRILILAALARKATSPRGSPAVFGKGVKSVDSLVALWFGIILIATSVELMEMQAVIKGLGDFLDAAGGYFVLRFLIQDRKDVERTLKTFAALTVVLGGCMIGEQVTHLNVFGLLGGAPLNPQVRDGKLRAQAAFAVYIDAGVFGAALMPLFIWLWSNAKMKAVAALGFAGAATMMITSNSSTPLLAFFGAIVGLCLWPVREGMRLLRWGIVLTLVGLHLVMNAPVWSLIARVDLTGSSSGYHRYYLVDNCIRHFSDWWLVGYKDYPNWGWDMWDLSDQYVAVALTGGLAALVVFIRILSRSFGGLGIARKRAAGDRKKQWFLWCLGAGLLAHVVGWFGCSYMAQMQILLFALLAMISVAVSEDPRLPESQPAALDDVHTPQLGPHSEELHGILFS